MSLRVPSLTALLLCLSGCTFRILEPPTPPPEASEWVPLELGLQALARDLNEATPVALSDIKKADGKAQLKAAIFARQCVVHAPDPPLPVITGPVTLQLQGSFQDQRQLAAQVGLPTAAQIGFQVQLAKARQQQISVPITFVPASALSNFFLGQNLTTVSTLPDKPDALPPPKKGSPPPSGPPADKAGLEQEKTRIQGELIAKAQAIYQAAKEQVDAYKADADCSKVTQQGIGLMTTLPISVILPQGFTFNELSQ
jgi:hypothetical protein